MNPCLRRILILAMLWNARCVSGGPTSDRASGDGGVVQGRDERATREVGFEEFKSACLRRLERNGFVTTFRPYEGLDLTVKLTLERRGSDEYVITSGDASITSPAGTTRVELRGRMSFSMSAAKNGMVGEVQSVAVEGVSGATTLAKKRLWSGYEGKCPLELSRADDAYRGFVSFVMPLEVGDVEFPSAFALPCELSLDRTRMVLGADESVDPKELLIAEPRLQTGGLILAGDLALGGTNPIRIVQGPGDSRFVLYESDRLSEKTAAFEDRPAWYLDRSRQHVVAEGTLDRDGEATIPIDIPEDPALVGSLRVYQALVEAGGAKLATGPAVVKIVKPAHGASLRRSLDVKSPSPYVSSRSWTQGKWCEATAVPPL
jgi:hypothetical protein